MKWSRSRAAPLLLTVPWEQRIWGIQWWVKWSKFAAEDFRSLEFGWCYVELRLICGWVVFIVLLGSSLIQFPNRFGEAFYWIGAQICQEKGHDSPLGLNYNQTACCFWAYLLIPFPQRLQSISHRWENPTGIVRKFEYESWILVLKLKYWSILKLSIHPGFSGSIQNLSHHPKCMVNNPS